MQEEVTSNNYQITESHLSNSMEIRNKPAKSEKIFDAVADLMDGSLLVARGVYKLGYSFCTDMLIPTGKCINNYLKNIILDNSEIGFIEEKNEDIIIFENETN